MESDEFSSVDGAPGDWAGHLAQFVFPSAKDQRGSKRPKAQADLFSFLVIFSSSSSSISLSFVCVSRFSLRPPLISRPRPHAAQLGLGGRRLRAALLR